jgi:hypothetical protein
LSKVTSCDQVRYAQGADWLVGDMHFALFEVSRAEQSGPEQMRADKEAE